MSTVTMNEMRIHESQKKDAGELMHFLQENDEDLHKVYYYMQAQWYGVYDAEIHEKLEMPYKDWATDWYYELKESGFNLQEMKEEVKSVKKEYVFHISQEYELEQAKEEHDEEAER